MKLATEIIPEPKISKEADSGKGAVMIRGIGNAYATVAIPMITDETSIIFSFLIDYFL